MALSDDDSIERPALRVIDRSLPKSEWTHAGHFAAALWPLRNRRDLTTPDEITNLITRYNEATSTADTDAGGYHHTIRSRPCAPRQAICAIMRPTRRFMQRFRP
ncbi:hypothetical protein [Methylosinus sp. Sm6]|uniref:hypothetical protein n=1 Tax=Methylosinus sp. Sm6 TaxID=2866948 RepID=UPI001C991413|nr:hypothetical protein [Methylosinus sp. Sm6]MBY6239691.1 hypothetical protein [Methylosinus sp. Sm6]